MQLRRFLLSTLIVPCVFAATRDARQAVPQILDLFDRPVEPTGLRIVDWEGHLANPALPFFVAPPAGVVYPATLEVTADHPRLYFTGTSQVGPNGPRFTRSLQNGNPRRFLLSVFPDRAGVDDLATLSVTITDDEGSVFQTEAPIRVVDQDRPERALEYHITLDYSEDESGFFEAEPVRALTRQVANDWAYFFLDPGYDRVPAGQQSTFIWNWPLGWTGSGGHTTFSLEDYAGFLMYAYGIRTTQVRSGGSAATCCRQTNGGLITPLCRGGNIAMEVRGNFNQLGWIINTDEDAWWVSRNFSNQANDLYSITKHEMGHALAFIASYPVFATAEGAGAFEQDAVVSYHGGPVSLDSGPDHLMAVDRLSRRGAFGNEYNGPAPARRWLTTKLDLLILREVGYLLRDTTAFTPFTVTDDVLERTEPGTPYEDGFAAESSLPFFDWVLSAGELPPGIALDRFTGRVHGTATEPGIYPLDVRVRDYDQRDVEVGQTFCTTLHVGRAWSAFDEGATDEAPVLSGTGRPGLDNELRVGLTAAYPNSQAFLLVGTERIQLASGLSIPRPDAFFVLSTNGNGTGETHLRWPQGVDELFFQVWQPDETQPGGWARTTTLSTGIGSGAAHDSAPTRLGPADSSSSLERRKL